MCLSSGLFGSEYKGDANDTLLLVLYALLVEEHDDIPTSPFSLQPLLSSHPHCLLRDREDGKQAGFHF